MCFQQGEGSSPGTVKFREVPLTALDCQCTFPREDDAAAAAHMCDYTPAI